MSVTYGIVAEFESSGALLEAAEKLHKEGYTKFDAHSPFPIHGMDRAMGLKQSLLPWIVLVGGLTGLSLGAGLQIWVHNFEYPLVIGGKPFLSYPAFVPVAYELTILLSAFGAVFGMLGLNGLPRPNHPVFNAARFVDCSNNAFFVSVEAADGKFDAHRTKDFLQRIGARNIELVNE